MTGTVIRVGEGYPVWPREEHWVYTLIDRGFHLRCADRGNANSIPDAFICLADADRPISSSAPSLRRQAPHPVHRTVSITMCSRSLFSYFLEVTSCIASVVSHRSLKY